MSNALEDSEGKDVLTNHRSNHACKFRVGLVAHCLRFVLRHEGGKRRVPKNAQRCVVAGLEE